MKERIERIKTTSTALLACPFCGGQAVAGLNLRRDGYVVGCKTYGCIAEVAWGAKWIDERNGIKAWNKRANTGGQHEQVAERG
jgi:transcription elongation factor Elf1